MSVIVQAEKQQSGAKEKQQSRAPSQDERPLPFLPLFMPAQTWLPWNPGEKSLSVSFLLFFTPVSHGRTVCVAASQQRAGASAAHRTTDFQQTSLSDCLLRAFPGLMSKNHRRSITCELHTDREDICACVNMCMFKRVCTRLHVCVEARGHLQALFLLRTIQFGF